MSSIAVVTRHSVGDIVAVVSSRGLESSLYEVREVKITVKDSQTISVSYEVRSVSHPGTYFTVSESNVYTRESLKTIYENLDIMTASIPTSEKMLIRKQFEEIVDTMNIIQTLLERS